MHADNSKVGSIAPTSHELDDDHRHHRRSVEHDGPDDPAAVERGVTRGNWTEIKAGLAQGDEIVTQGAYVLKSMLLKSMIGDDD